jgi:hypothetical protein
MKTKHFLVIAVAFIISTVFSSCQKMADIGSFQEGSQTYQLDGFTKLQMGSAFKIDVQKGTAFSVVARGDQRNLNDLRVRVQNGTLIADYYPHYSKSRQYRTEFTIIMPALEGVEFSGATESNVGGFDNQSVYIDLSGASVSTFSVKNRQTDVRLSGASRLKITGEGKKMNADISGASFLESFSFPTEESQVRASGASNAKVNVSKALGAEASGGSEIRYVGNPTGVSSNATGGSRIIKD